ncbi:glycoside hydrolase family 88/105 protein [Paenibacillus riograndensis]|uniref:Glycosyl hydrolase family protein n=1 Tax=Paenibacillus riograndensis SBR5 TaxID=1073571 RepID=A0A0E4CYR6_9BACL|nr:glycoside hydrolase family 88 protein [Paenibacillus riograndensis]CQR57726.1 glycosyl hydrolase family protein [Paenibacillus riograndensis SBR5]
MKLQTVANRVWKEMTGKHDNNWGMNIENWDWVPGVGVIALLEYYESSGDPEVLVFLTEWVARNKHKAEETRVINSIAPYAVFPALYRLTGDEWLKEEAVRIADWLLKEAPKTREQALEHTVTEKADFSEQVWADTIFMAVLFLARTAKLVENKSYAEEALKQVLIHLRLLNDKEHHVLFHGWNCNSGDHMSGARWTRANAWIAAGVPLIVKEIAPLIAIPDELGQRYGCLLAGLVSFQQKDGLWSTVMDQPGFYREISGSAGIAYGLQIAMEQGLVDASPVYESAAERALQAILPYISEAGVVDGVSGGTPVMDSVEAYNRIPVYPALYGQGLVLMLLAKAPGRKESQE